MATQLSVHQGDPGVWVNPGVDVAQRRGVVIVHGVGGGGATWAHLHADAALHVYGRVDLYRQAIRQRYIGRRGPRPYGEMPSPASVPAADARSGQRDSPTSRPVDSAPRTKLKNNCFRARAPGGELTPPLSCASTRVGRARNWAGTPSSSTREPTLAISRSASKVAVLQPYSCPMRVTGVANTSCRRSQ
jgi:hypothetical protein